jgi:hypothetical protein
VNPGPKHCRLSDWTTDSIFILTTKEKGKNCTLSHARTFNILCNIGNVGRCTCTCNIQYNMCQMFTTTTLLQEAGWQIAVSNSKLLIVYLPYRTLLRTQKRMQGGEREIRVKSIERRHWHPRVLTLLVMHDLSDDVWLSTNATLELTAAHSWGASCLKKPFCASVTVQIKPLLPSSLIKLGKTSLTGTLAFDLKRVSACGGRGGGLHESWQFLQQEPS